MLKLIVGEMGTNKTGVLLDKANELIEVSENHIVYIDHDNRHLTDLKHEVRFVNIADFPIDNVDEFLGFLCGIISNDYDIKHIFIDGLFKVMKTEIDDLSLVLPRLEKLSEMYKLDFYITVSAKKIDSKFDKYLA
ncbi:MAG: twitching motility protein PilT [Clostridiales bacterium]|nr:MAG: twitching motility protein PilT [Clostridiales bacterium]